MSEFVFVAGDGHRFEDTLYFLLPARSHELVKPHSSAVKYLESLHLDLAKVSNAKGIQGRKG
jgi:hypothetical protein